MISFLWAFVRLRSKKKRFRRFYGQFVNEGDLCYDIGAHLGSRSQVFLGLGAKVVSVEPVQELCLELQSKFNYSKNITILPVAIGAAAGQEKIYISNYSQLNTLSIEFIEKYKKQPEYNITWNDDRIIETTTLDYLIQKYGTPAFCKIDVEGYEKEVLKGLSKPLKMLSFEYNHKLKNCALDCLRVLEKFNHLKYNFSPYETMEFTLESWTNPKDFYLYIQNLNDGIKTGDIYVSHEP